MAEVVTDAPAIKTVDDLSPTDLELKHLTPSAIDSIDTLQDEKHRSKFTAENHIILRELANAHVASHGKKNALH